MLDALRRDVLGAGPLEPLLRLDGVTDVLVNGPAQVFVDRGDGLELDRRSGSPTTAPCAGSRSGSPPPAGDGSTTRRRTSTSGCPTAPGSTPSSPRSPGRARCSPCGSRAGGCFDLAELVGTGTVCEEGADLLRRIVDRRLAFLVSGGTGSGKTTLLAALLSLVDPTHRLVLVEDASELRPEHPHVVALEARPANVEGAGAVPLQVLVRQALRMRPDRIVVGEVRGAEVADLLAAMNTGHEGGCGTLHANSSGDVPARIEALAMAAGLPRAAAHSQLASARRRGGPRRALRRGADGWRRSRCCAGRRPATWTWSPR